MKKLLTTTAALAVSLQVLAPSIGQAGFYSGTAYGPRTAQQSQGDVHRVQAPIPETKGPGPAPKVVPKVAPRVAPVAPRGPVPEARGVPRYVGPGPGPRYVGPGPGPRYVGPARPYYRPWGHRPYYGRVIGGVALGAIIGVAAIGMIPPRPAPDLCWYWADPYRNRGYWDYCY